MRHIHEALRAAWLASGLTQRELIARAALEMSQAALSRKLSGTTSLTTVEAEALARALDVALVWAA
jgi:transcriptional regulator with XRE-family HTH domain